MEPPNVSKCIPHDMVNFGTGRNQHHTDATFISRHIYLWSKIRQENVWRVLYCNGKHHNEWSCHIRLNENYENHLTHFLRHTARGFRIFWACPKAMQPLKMICLSWGYFLFWTNPLYIGRWLQPRYTFLKYLVGDNHSVSRHGEERK